MRRFLALSSVAAAVLLLLSRVNHRGGREEGLSFPLHRAVPSCGPGCSRLHAGVSLSPPITVVGPCARNLPFLPLQLGGPCTFKRLT